MNVDEMEAGFALNRLIDIEVMQVTPRCEFKGTGIREVRNFTSSEFCLTCGKPYGNHQGWPAYSECIGGAWLVVEKIETKVTIWRNDRTTWSAALYPQKDGAEWRYLAVADSAPLAICRAALKAVRASAGA